MGCCGLCAYVLEWCHTVDLVAVSLRMFCTDFQSDYTNLLSHQRGMGAPLSAQPHQHLLSATLLILAILNGVVQKLKVSLMRISLKLRTMTSFWGSYLFLCLLMKQRSDLTRFIIWSFVSLILFFKIVCIFLTLRTETTYTQATKMIQKVIYVVCVYVCVRVYTQM